MNTWVALAEAKYTSFARYDPFHTVIIPILCWEVLLTLAMWGAWEFFRKWPTLALPGNLLFLMACLVPLGIISVAILQLSPVNLIPLVRKPWFWSCGSLIAMVPFVFAIGRPASAARAVRGILLWSWPLLAVIIVQGARHGLLKYPLSSYADGALAPVFSNETPRVRMMWIIFDELSQAIAFENRARDLKLPEFDRFVAESFHATAAHSPADSTEHSMPELILGETTVATIRQGPDSLRFRTPSHSDSFSWAAAPNVFDDARSLGLNTALVGWFLPYGREINRSLTRCYWTAGWLQPGIEEPSDPQPVLAGMAIRARLQFASLPLVGHLPGIVPWAYERQEKRKRFQYLLEHARLIVADPSIGLALIHLPIPHPPAIYNRFEARFSNVGAISYLDNVALADRTLGELRRAMEQAGVWDRTAVLVSADHGWRTHLWRGGPGWTTADEAASHVDASGVPFLLKLPQQSNGLSYTEPFNTIVTRAIITEILTGRLSAPGAIPEAIERAGKNGQSAWAGDSRVN